MSSSLVVIVSPVSVFAFDWFLVPALLNRYDDRSCAVIISFSSSNRNKLRCSSSIVIMMRASSGAIFRGHLNDGSIESYIQGTISAAPRTSSTTTPPRTSSTTPPRTSSTTAPSTPSITAPSTSSIRDSMPTFSDDDDFDLDERDRLNAAIASADMVRMMGTDRNVSKPKRQKMNPGPRQRIVRLKLYYVPDASPIPKKFQATDPFVALHMSRGYGK